MNCVVRPPFTSAQWQELEHQALIFKYMMAGMPVPQELVLPFRASFESMPARFYPHPTMGYCSFYGKKPDPEPGRCRRTDGKKWRCSKDAYPDSKYCERHMHRGRNRSRKPVEAQTLVSHSSSSTATAANTSLFNPPSTESSSSSSSCCGEGTSFQNLSSLHHSISTTHQGPSSGNSSLQLHTEHPGPYAFTSKNLRYLPGFKGNFDGASLFSGAPACARGIGMEFSPDNAWCLMPTGTPSFSSPKPRNGCISQSNDNQLQPLHEIGYANYCCSSAKQLQQQQHSFFRNEFGLAGPVKQEEQSLRPFLDEWPKARDSWSELDKERSNCNSFSTTQLSISIPMSSSDYSASTSRSPNDD